MLFEWLVTTPVVTVVVRPTNKQRLVSDSLFASNGPNHEGAMAACPAPLVRSVPPAANDRASPLASPARAASPEALARAVPPVHLMTKRDYHTLTEGDRECVEARFKEKVRKPEIRKELGIRKKALNYELKNNCSPEKVYCAAVARKK